MDSSSRDHAPSTCAATPKSAATKERTWPCCVCIDPARPGLWNVRGLDSYVIFSPGLPSKVMAEQAKAALNAHFDYGRSAGK